jgi:predicted nucleic acid-binding protein
MLLDTSGLLCLLDESDKRHGEAQALYKTADEPSTHNYVLAEFVPLCQSRRINRADALTFVIDLLHNPRIEVVWVDEFLHRTALTLLQARLDKTYSLCDAVSFLVMRQRGMTEALTTDRHFAQEGFRRLLQP